MDKIEIMNNNIDKYSIKKISLNNNIDNERFQYISEKASTIKYAFEYKRNIQSDSHFSLITLRDRYEYILRTIYYNRDKANFTLYNIEVIFSSEAEKDLFITLFTDHRFEYLNYYKSFSNQSNNDIKQKLIKNYGFYSLSLLRLELRTIELQKKIESEKNLQHEKHSKR